MRWELKTKMVKWRNPQWLSFRLLLVLQASEPQNVAPSFLLLLSGWNNRCLKAVYILSCVQNTGMIAALRPLEVDRHGSHLCNQTPAVLQGNSFLSHLSVLWIFCISTFGLICPAIFLNVLKLNINMRLSVGWRWVPQWVGPSVGGSEHSLSLTFPADSPQGHCLHNCPRPSDARLFKAAKWYPENVWLYLDVSFYIFP